MITINELQDKWSNITSYVDGFLLVTGEHPLSFHIGYNGGQKCFIVLATGYIEKLTSSKAISVTCVKTNDGQYAISFTLNYPTLDEIFVKLCWDLIDSSKSSQTPVAQILKQYSSWLKLLHQVSIDLLPSTLQKGLIGELLYLAISIEKYGEDDALNAWVGPEGNDQDFIFVDYWAEIKATTIASDKVTISSLQQLDRPQNGFLVVYFMDKTTDGSNNITLPGAVNKIKAMIINSGNKDKLECKLAKCGYFHKDSLRYGEFKFHLAEKRTYCVDNTFPCLNRNNVATAIVSVKYNISLAAIDNYKITGG